MMRFTLVSLLALVLFFISAWVSYRTWQTQRCRAQTLDLLSVSHYDEVLNRRVTLGEILQKGELTLKSCRYMGGVELIWQSESLAISKLAEPIKLVDKAPIILYFKVYSKLYSWALGTSQLEFMPIALPQIKSLIEK